MGFDRAAIEELYDYTGWAWNEIIAEIEAQGGDEFLVRAAPGSGWPALRECLGHIVLGYHRWLGEPVVGLPPFDAEAFGTVARVNERYAEVRARFRAKLDGYDDVALLTVRDFVIDGDTVRHSPGELLAHLLLHERGHHGDISTLFYQHGLEGPMNEYRFHLGRHPD